MILWFKDIDGNLLNLKYAVSIQYDNPFGRIKAYFLDGSNLIIHKCKYPEDKQNFLDKIYEELSNCEKKTV